ncbi:hypothetical protein [Streptomyces sp. NPDC017230]|uniref:hypothetical protein n=1 Tax=unclassified Streptomyces TaxID=2593676 RepID=UPI0037A06257
MPRHETERNRDVQLPTSTPADLASALRTCLTPLKSGRVYDGVFGYVLHGTGPEMLAVLDDPRSTKYARMVSGSGNWPDESVAAVADLHPG